jgi:hypothetical protein
MPGPVEKRRVLTRARNLAVYVIPRQCSRKAVRILQLRYQHHECHVGLFFPPGDRCDTRNNRRQHRPQTPGAAGKVPAATRKSMPTLALETTGEARRSAPSRDRPVAGD